MMGSDIFLLKPIHGKRNSLDKAYNKHVTNISKNIAEDDEERWEIYSIIIEDLINKGKKIYLNEIKYRITDGEDPNYIMLDIIEREATSPDGIDSMIWYFKRRIEEYIDDDLIKKFLP